MIATGIASAKIHLSDELATMQSHTQNLLVYFLDGAADLGLPVISDRKSPRSDHGQQTNNHRLGGNRCCSPWAQIEEKSLSLGQIRVRWWPAR